MDRFHHKDQAEVVYRLRRTHKKSKNGCQPCKQSRKKCDEISPRCTRCNNRDLTCHYRHKNRICACASTAGLQSSQASPPRAAPLDLELVCVHKRSFGTEPAPSTSSSLSAHRPVESSPTSPSNVTYSISPYSSQLCNPFAPTSLGDHVTTPYTEPSPALPQLSNSLTPVELSLLQHYLTHTSLSIAVDAVDLYALQTGFPTLAFRSRILMDSILALAAVCKARDILTHAQTIRSTCPAIRSQERHHILTLLAFADQHHNHSLSQTKTDLTLSIPDNETYDYLLSNAPLMVLYGSANHAVRVLFTETASPAELSSLGPDFVPNQSQWINLVRAAHLAYTGMLNDTTESAEGSSKLLGGREGAMSGSETLKTDTVMPDFLMAKDFMLARTNTTPCDQPSAMQSCLLTPEDGPTEWTRQLLMPIVAATSNSALAKLRQNAEKRKETHEGEACLSALGILDDIAAQVFRKQRRREADKHKPPPPLLLLAQSRLSRVSPWLRDYLSRVTMATHTNPMRRTVTAFINRVPAEYLRLFQPVLELITLGGSLMQLSGSQRLVLDIFAHWLVLTMLLDGVWWIGGIGIWELGRIVESMGARGWYGDPKREEGKRDAWWPASMYKIARELKRQVIDE